jgi:nitrate/nitrite transporter NarK
MFFCTPAKMTPYLETSTGWDMMSELMSQTRGTLPYRARISLGAVDGIVGAIVEIGGFGIDLELILGGM